MLVLVVKSQNQSRFLEREGVVLVARKATMLALAPASLKNQKL
jgi:hypothetical protein